MQISLALSGGSARGLMHIGILQAFEEIGIRPAHISACSSGGIIGALYAYGYSPKEIASFFSELNLMNLIKFDFSRLGILSIEKLRPLFEKYLQNDNFSALKIPMTINTTEIRKGISIEFSEGELIRVLQASACIPVIFKPIRIDDYLLIDGGIINNMPTETLQKNGHFIIGVNCNFYGNQPNPSSPKQLLENVARLLLSRNTELDKQFCDYIIEPPEMSQFNAFDLKHSAEMIRIGYDYTLKIADDLIQRIK